MSLLSSYHFNASFLTACKQKKTKNLLNPNFVMVAKYVNLLFL